MRITLKGGMAVSTKIEALPAGIYNATITEAIHKTATTGNEMIAVTFTMTDDEYKNRVAWRNYVLTDKAIVFIKRLLEAADIEFEESGDDMIFNTEDMLGASLKIQLGQELYQGEPKNVVEKVYKSE